MAPPAGGSKQQVIDRITREADKLTPAYRKALRAGQQAQWEEDAYRDKIGVSSFNVVNYDHGDLLTTSNTYTMSAALSND